MLFLVLKCVFPQSLVQSLLKALHNNEVPWNVRKKTTTAWLCNKSVLVFLKWSWLPNELFGDFIRRTINIQTTTCLYKDQWSSVFHHLATPFLINPSTCWQGRKLFSTGWKCDIKNKEKTKRDIWSILLAWGMTTRQSFAQTDNRQMGHSYKENRWERFGVIIGEWLSAKSVDVWSGLKSHSMIAW